MVRKGNTISLYVDGVFDTSASSPTVANLSNTANLRVGDTAFQKKCLGKMDRVSKAGRTVLLVSHNLASIQSLCHRAIWMHGGRLRVRQPNQPQDRERERTKVEADCHV